MGTGVRVDPSLKEGDHNLAVAALGRPVQRQHAVGVAGKDVDPLLHETAEERGVADAGGAEKDGAGRCKRVVVDRRQAQLRLAPQQAHNLHVRVVGNVQRRLAAAQKTGSA